MEGEVHPTMQVSNRDRQFSKHTNIIFNLIKVPVGALVRYLIAYF